MKVKSKGIKQQIRETTQELTRGDNNRQKILQIIYWNQKNQQHQTDKHDL